MRYSRLTVDGSCSYRIKPPFSTSLHVGPGKFGVLVVKDTNVRNLGVALLPRRRAALQFRRWQAFVG